MSLNTSLNIATTGLRVTEYAIGVASQNIANAGTNGYIAEIANVRSLNTNGQGTGVQATGTTLASNDALNNAVLTQNAQTSLLTAQKGALSALTSVQGSTDASSGSSGTLSDQLGNLQSSLISLLSTPTSSAGQNTAVTDATELVSTVHTLADTYQTQRQTAQDTIVSSVSSINTDLTTIGSLSTQIMRLKAQGQSTAELENQRNTAVTDLSTQISIKTTATANGDMVVKTGSGLVLPTHDVDGSTNGAISSSWPLDTSSATVTSAMAYPGTDSSNAIPKIMLGDRDVTSLLQGGTLGGNVALRDTILPTMQAQLDSFSYSLATRFDAQGMTLFTNSVGALPSADGTANAPSGIVGFSQNLQVSAAYTSDPSKLVNGSSADTSVLQAVISKTFASSATSAPSAQLGVNGNLSTGYDGTEDILSLATTLTASQAAVADNVSSNLTTAQATQTSLATSLSSAVGVSVDDEMSKVVALQNAYTANAKVVAAVQSMFQSLMSAIGA